jgi:hypothetical protein
MNQLSILLSVTFKHFVTWTNAFKALSMLSLISGLVMLIIAPPAGVSLIGSSLMFGFFFAVLDKLNNIGQLNQETNEK